MKYNHCNHTLEELLKLRVTYRNGLFNNATLSVRFLLGNKCVEFPYLESTLNIKKGDTGCKYIHDIVNHSGTRLLYKYELTKDGNLFLFIDSVIVKNDFNSKDKEINYRLLIVNRVDNSINISSHKNLFNAIEEFDHKLKSWNDGFNLFDVIAQKYFSFYK